MSAFPPPLCLTFLSGPVPELELEVREGAVWERKGQETPLTGLGEQRRAVGPHGAQQPVFLCSYMQTTQHPGGEGGCWWQEVFPERSTRAWSYRSAWLCGPSSPLFPLWVSFTLSFGLYPFCLSPLEALLCLSCSGQLRCTTPGGTLSTDALCFWALY